MAGRSDGAGGIAATGVARSTARGIVLAGVAVLGVLLWGGYVRHWAWTGFGDNDTLWDWLELALLPTAVATLPPVAAPSPARPSPRADRPRRCVCDVRAPRARGLSRPAALDRVSRQHPLGLAQPPRPSGGPR